MKGTKLRRKYANLGKLLLRCSPTDASDRYIHVDEGWLITRRCISPAFREIEAKAGRPVISSNQAMIGDTLRLAAVTDNIEGHGWLLLQY
jgi:hypothetical protein